jgi:hypothetical protein
MNYTNETPGKYTYAVFPSTVSPVVWFNGNLQAYSDLAGTIPVNSGLIRSISDGVSGLWTTTSDIQRPFKDSNSLRFECANADFSTIMTHPPVSVNRNACTIVVSFLARDNSYGALTFGLFTDDTVNAAINVTSGITIRSNAGSINWGTGLSLTQGVNNILVVRFTSTTIDITVNSGGIITTATLTGQTIPSSAISGSWYCGWTGNNGVYGSISQAMVIGKTVSDSERDALIAWTVNQIVPPAYPNSSILFGYVGDSITRMSQANYGLGYPFLALASIRNAGYIAENCDTAISGSGVTNILNPADIPFTPFLNCVPFYSPARQKNIMVIQLGTNDIANGNGVAYTLYGTGSGSAYTGLYPACDFARNQGWKVVLITIGPRSDSMVVSQNTYNTQRAQLNNDILTNGLNHADRVVDTTGIVNFGRDGDSDNATYYSADKIHPINAGHALLAPSVTAALLSLM